MKSLSKFALLLLCVACKPAVNLDPDIQEIRQVLFSQQQAWNKGDMEGFMQGYWHNDSMQFISSRGARKGWDSTLYSYKKNYPNKEKMGELQFSLENIRFLDTPGRLAQVTGKWKLNYPVKKSESGYFSLIIKKISHNYRIIIDHTW